MRKTVVVIPYSYFGQDENHRDIIVFYGYDEETKELLKRRFYIDLSCHSPDFEPIGPTNIDENDLKALSLIQASDFSNGGKNATNANWYTYARPFKKNKT